MRAIFLTILGLTNQLALAAADPTQVLNRYPKLLAEPFGRGVFAHVRRPGGKTARNESAVVWAANPYISGSQLSYTWAELEPSDGNCRWATIERDLEPWARQGKKCWVEISTADKRAIGGRAGLATPGWIFQRGVPKIQAPGTASYPVFWDPRYQRLWGRFIHRFAKRFDGDPRLEFVSTGGYSSGHEPNLTSRDNGVLMDQWQDVGFDGFTPEGVYFRKGIVPILTFYRDAFQKTPVAQTIHVKSEFDEVMNRLAASYGFLLISNGMSVKVASPAARRQWRDRQQRYQTKVGYAEWGPTGRGGKRNRRSGKRRGGGRDSQETRRPGGGRGKKRAVDVAPLLAVYQGVIGDEGDASLRPSSHLSYVPLGKRMQDVETEDEWMAALRWASEHLTP